MPKKHPSQVTNPKIKQTKSKGYTMKKLGDNQKKSQRDKYRDLYKVSDMKLTSTAFVHQATIPARYTCEGVNISPTLHWDNVPANTQSLVLIMDDPDAPNGTWDHWLLFNLPATVNSLAEGTKELPPKTKYGKNSWGKEEYGGPCPPTGQHRYYFHLYALDTFLELPAGATKQQIQTSMSKHILATAELMGTYQKKPS